MSDYWRNRQADHIQEALENAEIDAKEISKLYEKSCFYLNDSIQKIYDRYKTKHGLSNAEAAALLNTMDDETSYNEMHQRLKNGAKTTERKELLKKLEAPSFRYRINQFQQSQELLDIMMKSVYNQEKKISTSSYVKTFNDSYYKTIYNLQNKTGINFSFNDIDPKEIDKLLKSKWSGKNYSRRIWNNTQEVADSVKKEMLIGLMTGKTEREMSETITERFAVGAYQARRLIRTESAFVSNMADLEAYREAGVESVRFCAVHDLRTSAICQRHDRKVVPISKAVAGVNIPPMHPHCRSTIEPVIDEEIEANMKRRVKNPSTGKDEIVSANETYQEWYERVQKGNKEDLNISKKKYSNYSSDREQYLRYKEVLGDEFIPDSFDKFQEMKYNDKEKYKDTKDYYLFKKSNLESSYNDYLLDKIKSMAPGNPHAPERINAYALKDVKAKKNNQNHLFERMIERGITTDELQEYVDNACVMFSQWNGKRRLYISSSGASVVVERGEDWLFKTAMKYTDYGDNYMTILEVLKKWKK